MKLFLNHYRIIVFLYHYWDYYFINIMWLIYKAALYIVVVHMIIIVIYYINVQYNIQYRTPQAVRVGVTTPAAPAGLNATTTPYRRTTTVCPRTPGISPS